MKEWAHSEALFLDERLNVSVEWLTLLLQIREVSVSNLGPEKNYSD
jgi:hypothetical protein